MLIDCTRLHCTLHCTELAALNLHAQLTRENSYTTVQLYVSVSVHSYTFMYVDKTVYFTVQIAFSTSPKCRQTRLGLYLYLVYFVKNPSASSNAEDKI